MRDVNHVTGVPDYEIRRYATKWNDPIVLAVDVVNRNGQVVDAGPTEHRTGCPPDEGW